MMIKKVLGLLSFLSIIISCQKGQETTPAVIENHSGTIGAVPVSFTQKVLLEIFTGAGQAQCTDGFVKEKDITDTYPSLAIPVLIHYSDAMEISYYTYLDSCFNNNMPPSFPSGLVNRTPSLNVVVLNRTQWLSNFNVAKSKTPVCGLALKTSLNDSVATVEVHAGFIQTLTGNYRLTVMMLENNVAGTGNQYDQHNAYNASAGHAYYGLGDPITSFKHDRVLRKMISANSGDLIPFASTVPGGHYVKTYTFHLGNYKFDDLTIVAFIDKEGTSSTTHEVMNAQKTKLGSTQTWD